MFINKEEHHDRKVLGKKSYKFHINIGVKKYMAKKMRMSIEEREFEVYKVGANINVYVHLCLEICQLGIDTYSR